MKNSDISENKNKKAVPLRLLHSAKKIICRLCGKARWYVLYITLMFILIFSVAWNSALTRAMAGVTKDGNQIDSTSLERIEQFSVTDGGSAVFLCDYGGDDMTAILNIDTKKKSYVNIARLIKDGFKNETTKPYNFAVTDDEIYAVESTDDDNSFISSETIIRISKDYRYKGDVCEIKYDPSERSRSSKLSRMHCHNGKITFAYLEKDEVYLYSIDTETKAVMISRSYPTDPDGTYTAQVIPIDDAFLFFRSDGNVYKTGFDEPLNDIIYRFDIKADKECSNFFFTQAALSDGRLYVTDENHPTEVYRLENGTLEKAFDISDTQGKKPVIRYIDSYRPADSQSDTLVLCLDNGLMTYADGTLTNRDLNIKTDTNILMYIYSFLGILMSLASFGLIINLIIRKKTLLYKQLILIVPAFLVLVTAIATNVYDFALKENNDNIEKDLGIICKLGTSEFDDYDFSHLLEINEQTGEAYHKLGEKLDKLSTEYLGKWSKEYIFSVVYRKNNGSTVVLARNDSLSIPMYSSDDIRYSEEEQDSDDLNVINNVYDFMSDKSRTSSIYAYEKISDKNSSGNIYLKVSTENYSFWTQRRDMFVKTALYCILIFFIITALITLTTMRITRTINKAGTAVRKMTKGDLTARIKYKSKDELGEICSQVNEMGQSLETLFEEKDRTEKFYYKFVPERFRELLGKNSFTELSLGDASSRDITVLFCDIRSFSVNSEMMTAKENFAFVNVIYGKAGPIIRRNNGFVDKYIGDAVMALFENADDAVKCGIELYRKIVLDPKTSEELKVSDINIGIGIHSGMAMIGIVGESERLSGTVISDTVNLSSRLETLTKQYKTAMLISKDTVDRMSDPDTLDLRYLGIIQVAGVNEVKAVYEVLDCLPDDERSKRSANNTQFREAVRLFHLGRRKDAVQALQEISASGKSDRVIEMYLRYISDMSDDDKGNVFRFVRK